MKKIFILGISIAAISCSSLSTSENSIQEYLRAQTGFSDLEIEFSDVQITKQTVQDSIDILQELFEEQTKKKEDAIKKTEKNIQGMLETLKSTSKKDPDYNFLTQFIRSNESRLKELQKKAITNGKVYYDGQDPKKVIATLVQCEMTSLINPALKAKQTKKGLFLLSPDEKVCIRQIE